MLRLPEVVQFRAPLGTCVALESIARAEGKPVAEIVREAVRARIAAEGSIGERRQNH